MWGNLGRQGALAAASPGSDSLISAGSSPFIFSLPKSLSPPDLASAEKIQSPLLKLAALSNTAGPKAAVAYASEQGLKISDGKVQVVIESAANVTENVSRIAAVDGRVETSYRNLIQALVPISRLNELAMADSIAYIRKPARPVKSAVSEGVADIGASTWHNNGNNGAGTKLAVVDIGFAGYTSRISGGDLPANTITKSFRFDGDITGEGENHGTACAEIAYDVAPGTQLYLINFSTDVELGNVIDYLVRQGIQVASASWTFYGNSSGDGQGEINDMIETAANGGVFWANAAGNIAQKHWSGNFTDTNNNSWSEFSGSDEHNSISASAGTSIDLYLSWNRWPSTSQDYDLYLVSSSLPNTIVDSSEELQTGTQPPAEEIHYQVPAGKGGTYYIMIKKHSAAGDARFQLFTDPFIPAYRIAGESLAGQPADSPYAMTVGAVPSGSTGLEPYSSQGPTTDGRIKPDIVGPDGVTTATNGYKGFWGTSAATPHVAGAAALVKSANPSYSPALIQSELESMVTDLGAPGKDSMFGSGKLSMTPAADATPPVVRNVEPHGTILTTSPTISASYSDSSSGINTASVVVKLDGNQMNGCNATASGVSCKASGLGIGTHKIEGSVADNAGNQSQISGSFSVFLPLGGGGPPLPLL